MLSISLDTTGLHTGHLHATIGFFFVNALTQLMYGKKVGVALLPWGLGIPSAASAVSERLGTAGCNEFGEQGGHRDLQDERLGLGARTCASDIPI